MSTKVDVAINALGKPYETALALFSLMEHSGAAIDKIYFVAEKAATTDFSFILDRLKNIVVHHPKYWFWSHPVIPERLVEDDYRWSMRYQYALEHSDKDFLFITHNDTLYRGDIITLLLDKIGDGIAAGHVGQCWNCPAAFVDRCGSERYLNYRPSYPELLDLYTTAEPPKGKQIHTYHRPDFDAAFKQEPWPLPECRVNEWAMLINLKKARPLTTPFGAAPPYAFYGIGGGAKLDLGVAWFRAMHHLGHHAVHVSLKDYVKHKAGRPALFDQELYLQREAEALKELRRLKYI